jgi:hypothetical protein
MNVTPRATSDIITVHNYKEYLNFRCNGYPFTCQIKQNNRISYIIKLEVTDINSRRKVTYVRRSNYFLEEYNPNHINEKEYNVTPHITKIMDYMYDKTKNDIGYIERNCEGVILKGDVTVNKFN